MKYICEKDMCTGCKACINICNKNAITLVDNIKSLNSVIDENLCVDCGMCKKVCPNANPMLKETPILWKQGWALNSEIRRNSSSGGGARAIQGAFVESGGVVCSCCFRDGKVEFEFACTVNELTKFVGSKYVKSSLEGAYKQINKHLQDGKKVLFVGLPCQCAAVKNYIGSNDLLYTIDLICHGTPSFKLLEMYLEEKGYQIKNICNLKFREKNEFRLSDDVAIGAEKTVRDRYTHAFLESLCYTENCYFCQYASIERVADLTLGDSWGSELPDDEQKKGISLFLCQTEKGKELLNMADLCLQDVDLQKAIANNRQLTTPSQKPKQYDLFFVKLFKHNNFNKAMKRCYPKFCLRQDIKAFLIKHKIIKR